MEREEEATLVPMLFSGSVLMPQAEEFEWRKRIEGKFNQVKYNGFLFQREDKAQVEVSM